jgi:hypothetical protein
MMEEYDKDNKRTFFYRSLANAKNTPSHLYGTKINSPQDIVKKVEYSINEYGYRSDKFDKNNEVLVLGCSNTYGCGMPNKFTWPEIFSNSINKKYSRIASPGDSINGQVYKAFKYFEEVGNPEIVLGLFPLYRLEYSMVPNKLLSPTFWNQEKHKKNIDSNSIGVAYFYEEYLTKISRAPHDPVYVLPREFSIFYNFMFIAMLEQYCKSHNIKFIWSIYDDTNIEYFINTTPNILKNYLKTSEEVVWTQRASDRNCCEEFKDHKLYYWAADYNPEKQIGHWGIHTHKHMSNVFLNKYEKIKND